MEIYITYLANWDVCSKLLMAEPNGSGPQALWEGDIRASGTPETHLRDTGMVGQCFSNCNVHMDHGTDLDKM